MATELKLEKFNGPLDLLLQLIEQEKMSITDFALSAVTDQFLSVLAALPPERNSELADFLVVASRLAYLKSQALLPEAPADDKEGGASLADQLKLYERFQVASRKILTLWERGQLGFARVTPLAPLAPPVAPSNAAPINLRHAFQALLERLKPMTPLPTAIIDRAVSLRAKIDSIVGLLKRLVRVSFSRLVRPGASRTDVIVSFLAVLELAKQGKVSVAQAEVFGEFEISNF